MSNVPKSKRSLSDMQFYKTAIDLRYKVTQFMLRDFGLKPKARSVENLQKHRKMSEEDARTMNALLEKYRLGDQLIEEFPGWWINQRRLRIDKILSDLISAIRLANSIYPQSLEEYQQRRSYQNEAIGLTDCLLEEMSFVVKLLNRDEGIDIQKLAPFIDMIETEYQLLKGRRKADNKIRQRFK